MVYYGLAWHFLSMAQSGLFSIKKLHGVLSLAMHTTKPAFGFFVKVVRQIGYNLAINNFIILFDVLYYT